MKMPNDIPVSKLFRDLRKRAEKALQERSPDNLESAELSKEEMHSLIHELQVHQIELEMQNDELRRFQDKIEESRKKYSHLYDFAPVGYFTVKDKGMIAQANLTGAALLGIDRQSLIGKPLTRFIAREDQDTFYLHHLQVFKKKRVITPVKLKW
jgi:PAS domain-containing protein